MNRKSLLFLLIAFLPACGEEPTPKPKGYFRIATPEQKYQPLETPCPYRFQINQAAQWLPRENCWGDLLYPSLRATVQITYQEVNDSNLEKLISDSYRLTYEHTVKADGIEENLIYAPEERVFGLFYRLKGNAATSTQFFATDSSKHFLRGVLYFYAVPNADSLRPADRYMANEILHLINTLEWQN